MPPVDFTRAFVSLAGRLWVWSRNPRVAPLDSASKSPASPSKKKQGNRRGPTDVKDNQIRERIARWERQIGV